MSYDFLFLSTIREVFGISVKSVPFYNFRTDEINFNCFLKIHNKIKSCTFIPHIQDVVMLLTAIQMSLFLLFGLPGGAEWIIILFAILLLFGGKKIPELMKGIGKGIREFNDARNNIKQEIESGMKEEDSKKGKE